jgi:alkylhydroperoxidase/carboxymuconolactone decarboxylase family protein YurZ
MEEKTRILIALGAAVASNCIPCFEHIYSRAKEINLTNEEIQGAVETAVQVKDGARITLKNVVDELTDEKRSAGQPCCSQSQSSCCV